MASMNTTRTASRNDERTIKDKLNEVRTLLTSFDDPTVSRSEFKQGQMRIKTLVREIDNSNITLDGTPLSRYQIEVSTQGGRDQMYVFNTSLVGKKEWNEDYSGGENCFFECSGEKCTSSNMKQIYPDKQHIGDGNDYSSSRFTGNVFFITKLIRRRVR